MVEYKSKGIELQGMTEGNQEKSAMDMLNTLNKGDFKFLIFDALDDVHKRESLVLLDLEEIEDNSGVDKVFVMGHFNNQYKECLKLSNDLVENMMGIERFAV